MSQKHILIVEDEEKIAEILKSYLEKENFTVSWCDDGEKALDQIKRSNPDLILLDLMLPGKDGLSVCRELRSFSQTPVIMVTAKVDEIDRLIGLELGADDYICKPFLPREVVARVKAVLRRTDYLMSQSEGSGARDELGGTVYQNISISLDRFECSVQNEKLDLTPVELKMLEALLRKPGKVYSREALIEISYSDQRVVTDRTVDTHIKNIRKKLSAVGTSGDFIQSVYGVGYRVD